MKKKVSMQRCRQLVLFDEYWAEANIYAQGSFYSNSKWGGRIMASYLNRINSDYIRQKTQEPMPELFISFTELTSRRLGHHGGEQKEDIIAFVQQAGTGALESMKNGGAGDFVTIEETINGETKVIAYPLWAYIIYSPQRPNGITVKGNVALYKYLCDLNGKDTPFTLFSETEVYAFNTASGYKLYHFLKPFNYLGQKIIPLDELRAKLRLPVSYEKNSLLWLRFLKPAMEDINSSPNCPIGVTLEMAYDPDAPIQKRAGSYNILKVRFYEKPNVDKLS